LEKLAFKLSDEIVYDYWDSVWVHNEVLSKKTMQFATTISVANDYLYEHFSKNHSNIKYFNIGINLEKYIPKVTYKKNPSELNVFYTGSPGNVKQMLKEIGDYLLEFSTVNPIKLILVSSQDQTYKNLNVENHRFDENTFFKLLNTSDIGLYALDDSVSTRGKMAMKVLDYAGTGLPILATRYGLSPHLIDENNVLFCDTKKIGSPI
jgi:glycosyltransferase involved in cell wall biosynthesis